MAISALELFKIGMGPSSSHTVGPMRAAKMFIDEIIARAHWDRVTRFEVNLYGSLGMTGKGHGSDTAVILGLCGEEPDKVDVESVPALLRKALQNGIGLAEIQAKVAFNPLTDIVFHRGETLPYHSNGMRFKAFDETGQCIFERTYYSVGGGFVVGDVLADEDKKAQALLPMQDGLPYPFHSGAQLLELTSVHRCTIAEIVRRNERKWRSDSETTSALLKIWGVMQACVLRGCSIEGTLPGPFKVRRRARGLLQRLSEHADISDSMAALEWIHLFALAVNEENAAGGRVVTAPTNGAAGVIPAVLHYYSKFIPGANDEGVVEFLLTAAAIGMLYKENASISGAEVGCQGEVGVACSMAAAGLCAVLGGNPAQVENAAEIGMEHHLGLTCDPVGGLVQIPCIERNAIGAVKAVSAARMALFGDGTHHVSLDKVIKTMRETGADMLVKYKETSNGGLAVNIVEC